MSARTRPLSPWDISPLSGLTPSGLHAHSFACSTAHARIRSVSPPSYSIPNNLPSMPYSTRGGVPLRRVHTYDARSINLHDGQLRRTSNWGRRCGVSPTLHHRILSVRYQCLRYSDFSRMPCALSCEDPARTDPTAVRMDTNSLLSLFQVPRGALRSVQETASTYVHTHRRCVHTKVMHERLRAHHRLSGAHRAIGMQTDASRRPQYVRTYTKIRTGRRA